MDWTVQFGRVYNVYYVYYTYMEVNCCESQLVTNGHAGGSYEVSNKYFQLGTSSMNSKLTGEGADLVPKKP